MQKAYPVNKPVKQAIEHKNRFRSLGCSPVNKGEEHSKFEVFNVFFLSGWTFFYSGTWLG